MTSIFKHLYLTFNKLWRQKYTLTVKDRANYLNKIEISAPNSNNAICIHFLKNYPIKKKRIDLVTQIISIFFLNSSCNLRISLLTLV